MTTNWIDSDDARAYRALVERLRISRTRRLLMAVQTVGSNLGRLWVEWRERRAIERGDVVFSIADRMQQLERTR